jgi:succinyl-CoA synthetase beta subunit
VQIKQLIGKVPGERQEIVANFISSLYKLYVDLNFTYMEINPLVVVGNQVQQIIDVAEYSRPDGHTSRRSCFYCMSRPPMTL